MRTDHAHADRQQLIANSWPHNSLEAKRRRAIEYLGEKWVLHQKHAVKKNPTPGILVRVLS